MSEPEGLRFRSRHAGVMHACGHDAHMAMLLAAAAVLREARPPQNLRFLFQPAEEIFEGSIDMIKDGLREHWLHKLEDSDQKNALAGILQGRSGISNRNP